MVHLRNLFEFFKPKKKNGKYDDILYPAIIGREDEKYNLGEEYDANIPPLYSPG